MPMQCGERISPTKILAIDFDFGMGAGLTRASIRLLKNVE